MRSSTSSGRVSNMVLCAMAGVQGSTQGHDRTEEDSLGTSKPIS